MSANPIQAIDVHAHFGKSRGAAFEVLDRFMTGEPEVVRQRAKLARTKLTVVSPLKAFFPRFQGDAFSGNVEAVRAVSETDGLLQWVVINPLDPRTYRQAEEMLKSPRCVGIKIHPEEHGYPIAEHGKNILKFAAGHNAVVQSHSGDKNSLPADFVKLANEFSEVKIIISHLGWSWNSDPTLQVRAVQKNKHGNLFTDTSSARSIMPNLIEWAVREIGAQQILYGTDSPLYFAPMQRARIDNADISDREKRLILRDNAAGFFGLK